MSVSVRVIFITYEHALFAWNCSLKDMPQNNEISKRVFAILVSNLRGCEGMKRAREYKRDEEAEECSLCIERRRMLSCLERRRMLSFHRESQRSSFVSTQVVRRISLISVLVPPTKKPTLRRYVNACIVREFSPRSISRERKRERERERETEALTSEVRGSISSIFESEPEIRAEGKISKMTWRVLLHFTITMRGAAKAFPAPRSIKPSLIPLTERKRKVHTRTDTGGVYHVHCVSHACVLRKTHAARKKERKEKREGERSAVLHSEKLRRINFSRFFFYLFALLLR